MKCCDGEKPVLHKLGKRPENMQTSPAVQEPMQTSPEPQVVDPKPSNVQPVSGGSKLDQPLSGVKATVKGTK